MPFPVSGAPQRSSKKYCYSFNNNDGRCGRGQNCKYPHVCEKCGGAHFKRLCRQPYKGKSQPKLTTDQRTTMSPIKYELLPSPKVVTPIHPELIKHYLVVYDKTSTNFYLQVSLKGLGYLMKEIGNFVLIGTSHQQQKK